MKECPVCKETFQDDLNFCDLDGSPLNGGAGGTASGSSSKAWSFLGVGLLLAAVGITAGAILFFPRGPSATLPTGRSQAGIPAVSASQPAVTAQDGSATQADAPAGSESKTSATASSSPDQTRLASRRAGLSKNDNSDSSLPNPKSVINSDDEVTRVSSQPADETRPRALKPSSIGDAGTGAGAASGESRVSDSAAKAAATSAAKRRPKTQVQGSDSDPSGTKKDDKKKGGFLRVFKKIFGHG